MIKNNTKLVPGLYKAKNKNNHIMEFIILKDTIKYSSFIYTLVSDNLYVDMNNTNWTLLIEINDDVYTLKEFNKNQLDDIYSINKSLEVVKKVQDDNHILNGIIIGEEVGQYTFTPSPNTWWTTISSIDINSITINNNYNYPWNGNEYSLVGGYSIDKITVSLDDNSCSGKKYNLISTYGNNLNDVTISTAILQENIPPLQEENANLKQIIEDGTAEFNSLQEENANLKQIIENGTAEFNSLQEENANLQNQLETAQNTEGTDELTSLQEENANLKQIIENGTAELNSLQKQIEDGTVEFNSLQEENEELKNQLATAQNTEGTPLLTSLQEENANLKKIIEEGTAELTELQEKIELYFEDVSKLSEEDLIGRLLLRVIEENEMTKDELYNKPC